MKKTALFTAAVGILLLSACTGGIKNMNKEVDKTASELNAGFVHARESVIELSAFTENLFANINKYDLSIDKMDESKGGKYRMFQNAMYYKYTNDGTPAVAASGFYPVNDILKKRIKLYENAEPLMKSLINNDYSDVLIMDHNFALVFTYPWVDYISTIPPRFNIRNFPWITLANEKNNPSKSAVWLRDPFASLGGTGWMVVCIKPVYNGRIMEAVVSSDIYLTTAARGVFRQSKNMLLFITDKGSVIATSKSAQEQLKIKVLKEFDYLMQMKNNEFIQDEYKLTYKDNPQDIKDFGEQLMKNSWFDIRINGKKYAVYKKALEELPNLSVVGLVEE